MRHKVKSATLWNAVTILGAPGQQLVATRSGVVSRSSKKSNFSGQAVTGYLWSVLETRYKRRPGPLHYVRILEGWRGLKMARGVARWE